MKTIEVHHYPAPLSQLFHQHGPQLRCRASREQPSRVDNGHVPVAMNGYVECGIH
jgi:hypothetical protein